MGVIRPPWVTKTWFSQCPFNYCDHFGDKYVLATMCKICKDEIIREKLYKKAGKDPNDMKEVFKDIGNSLAHALYLLHKEAERLGIDLNNLEDVEEAPEPDNYPLFQAVTSYGKAVGNFIHKLSKTPVFTNDIPLIEKALEVLSHSRFYIVAKTHRAYSSKWEEAKDPENDLDDSKSSAFLAYIAIVRNEHTIRKLLNEGVIHYSLTRLAVQIRRASEEIAEYIREEFFPKDKLDYKEFGCNSYNKLFGIPNQSTLLRKRLSIKSGKSSNG